MRFMILGFANADSESGKMPDERGLRMMGEYNDELVKAGVLLAAEGLHASSRGLRVTFDGAERLVVDGPFAESKEVVAGYSIYKCSSREECLEWVKRAPLERIHDGPVRLEIRQIMDPEDFAASDPTGELRQKKAERVEAAARNK